MSGNKGGVDVDKPVNIMEVMVELNFQEVVKTSNILKCQCKQCVNDVIALTLNSLPSKYVSTKKGEAEAKALFSSTYAQAEIKRELIRSMIVVSANPNHEVSK